QRSINRIGIHQLVPPLSLSRLEIRARVGHRRNRGEEGGGMVSRPPLQIVLVSVSEDGRLRSGGRLGEERAREKERDALGLSLRLT
ncbi:unnamed protein product, partial [Musa hybrid cultivar]